VKKKQRKEEMMEKKEKKINKGGREIDDQSHTF